MDLAANARSYGIRVVEVEAGVDAIAQLAAAITAAKATDAATLIHIRSDPFVYAPDGAGWWDVPIAEVSELPGSRAAHAKYVEERRRQRPLLG